MSDQVLRSQGWEAGDSLCIFTDRTMSTLCCGCFLSQWLWCSGVKIHEAQLQETSVNVLQCWCTTGCAKYCLVKFCTGRNSTKEIPVKLDQQMVWCFTRVLASRVFVEVKRRELKVRLIVSAWMCCVVYGQVLGSTKCILPGPKMPGSHWLLIILSEFKVMYVHARCLCMPGMHKPHRLFVLLYQYTGDDPLCPLILIYSAIDKGLKAACGNRIVFQACGVGVMVWDCSGSRRKWLEYPKHF